MRTRWIGVGAMLSAVAFAAPAAAASTHADNISSYVGPATCAACHEGTAREVAESLHYQQLAIPLFLEGWPAGPPAGMMKSY